MLSSLSNKQIDCNLTFGIHCSLRCCVLVSVPPIPGIGICMNHQPGIGIGMNVQSGIGILVSVEHYKL